MFGLRFLSFAAMLFCLGSIYALSSEDRSGLKEALHPFIKQCEEEFGVTAERFQEAKQKGGISDIDPCFMSCFLKKAGFFDSKGMFDLENTTTFANSYLKSEEAINELLEMGSDCAKVNDEEVSDGEQGCERAKLMFDCLAEHRHQGKLED